MNGEREAAVRAVIASHALTYPKAEPRDLFKLLYQAAFGCEHLAPAVGEAAARIEAELAEGGDPTPREIEPLGGGFSRWPLTVGLSPRTLSALFVGSAAAPTEGAEGLRRGLAAALALAAEGALPFGEDELCRAIAAWEAGGFPAVRHSEGYRRAYHPAYRVIADRYLPLLPLLRAIDRRLAEGPLVLAIEGGAASGKSTLAVFLEQLYGATVLHTDDFFLRPEQRTPARLAEVGGNLDRERFLAEVVTPLSRGEEIAYRRYDCASGLLLPPTTVVPARLTVVEGSYAMHEAFGRYFGLSVFLDVTPALQRERILNRNPAMADRFFSTWIPMERAYHEGMRVRERCDIDVEVK